MNNKSKNNETQLNKEIDEKLETPEVIDNDVMHKQELDDENNFQTLAMSDNLASSLTRSQSFKETRKKRKNLGSCRNVNRNRSQSLVDDSGSKTCPKQVFPYIDCLPIEDNVILCYVLSAWDNIVGPQTVHVWRQHSGSRKSPIAKKTSQTKQDSLQSPTSKVDDKSSKVPIKIVRTSSDGSTGTSVERKNSRRSEIKSLDSIRLKLRLSEIVQFVTEHNVGASEIENTIDNKLVTLYLSVPHKRIAVFSVRFNLMEEEVSIPYCLSGIIHIDDEEKFLPYLPMTLDAIQRASVKIRLSIAKDGLEAGSKITPDLVEWSSTLSSLMKANLTMYPSNTLPDAPTDRHFAELMLTSHLQTGGYTLVASDSPNSANKVALWLSMFSAPETSKLSRFAFSNSEWPYQAGPKIQVILRDATGALDVSSIKLLCSGHPLTFVDLTTNIVRQMTLSAHTRKISQDAVKLELASLWCPSDSFGAPTHSLFEPVKNSSLLVKKLLKECDYLSSCEVDVRRTYVKYFRRSLYYIALSVVTYIREFHDASAKKKDRTSLKQDIISSFELEGADLKVVLSMAEDFEPGVMAYVYP